MPLNRTGLILALGVVGAWLYFEFGKLEVRVAPPVDSLVFDTFTCDGEDLIAHGVLDKGRDAEFLSLTVYLLPELDEPVRTGWKRPDPDDNSEPSRPTGVQQISLQVLDGCGEAFRVHTKHRGWATMRQTWGPFNE